MSLPPARSDEGVSSLLGFIVAMVIVVGSMATVVYVISTAPGTDGEKETRDLQGAALRVAEALTRTTGQPSNWTDEPLSEIQRVGLLESEGSRIVNTTKMEMIRDGTLTADRIAQIHGLEDEGLRLNITGRVLSIPLVTPPSSTTYAVGHFGIYTELIPGNLTYKLTEHSKNDLERFESANTGFEMKVNRWEYAPSRHPTTGLGNTVPDHGWFIETQLFPKMAGLAATHATWNDLNDSTDDGAIMSAFSGYVGNQVNRFHILEDENPIKIHGTVPSGSHVLTVAYNDNPAEAPGLGNWKTVNGGDAWALMGPIDITGAQDVDFTFTHKLKMPNETEEGTDDFPGPCHKTGFDEDCWAVRPSIKFWNDTSDQWTTVQGNVTCSGTEQATNWYRNVSKIATGGAWVSVDGTDAPAVNLCAAAEHAEGELWLTLHWDMWCNSGLLGRTNCDPEELSRSWFLDDLAVTADGETVWSTDLEPGSSGGRETLFVSSGVDHAPTYNEAAADRRAHAIHYLDDFVRAGGNAVILGTDATAREGDWLASIGVEAVRRDGIKATTADEDNIFMNSPWDLPNDDDDYLSAGLAWETGSVSNSVTGEAPTEKLSVVQKLKTGTKATVLRGQPFGETGGRVVALAYNFSTFDDADLDDHMLLNAYAGTTFLDPTFQTDASSARPEIGTTALHAARRVVLVPVTDDDTFQIPMEITVYVWPG